MFRNLQLFRHGLHPAIDASVLGEQLAALPFRDCTSHQSESAGWLEPVPGEGLARTILGRGGCRFTLLEHAHQQKLLPASVVNEIVDKEAAARGGVVSRKERQVMRENVIARLLPTALPKTTRTWVVLTSTGWAWVGCTSRGKAEDIISFLRETLGSFPAEPVPFASAPQRTLTRWVSTAETPEPFHFGEACEMRHPAEKSQVSRFAGADMTCEEIRNHLGLGMEVTRLALTWEDRLAFTVDADMALRGIQFLEGVLEEQDDAEVGDAALRLDADAQIACAEIESLIPVLYDALGGGAVNGVDDGVEFGLTGS